MSESRRHFLETAVAAGAFCLAGRAAAAKTGMFVSLNSTLTGKMAWPDFAALASTTGYGGVDVNFAPAFDAGEQATRALLAKLKIKPGIVNLPIQPFARQEEEFQKGLKNLDGAARFAAAIGCPRSMTVLPPASNTPKEELRKIYKERLAAVNEILVRHKVRLGLEFLGPRYFHTRLPHEFIWRMDEALEFAKECGPAIGLQLDSWHWYHAGATVADILAAGKSRIVSVHVSDARKQPPDEVRDNQRLMPGEGVIDLVGFFQALGRIGYRDAVSPEPIGRITPGMSPEEGARLGLSTTLAVMRKAGVA